MILVLPTDAHIKQNVHKSKRRMVNIMTTRAGKADFTINEFVNENPLMCGRTRRRLNMKSPIATMIASKRMIPVRQCERNRIA